jgi:putative peptidoglycan lipid II flippase
MALGTIASRGTGFVRTAVIAAALGTAELGDAYNVPNTVPNAIYDLLLGGILTSVVVPLLVNAVKDDAEAGEAYAQRLLTAVAVLLGVCTIVAVLAAPVIVDLYARRLTGAQRDLAITFARYFLPQIFFYGLSATIGAILNSRGRFAAPMWAPVLNNLVLIVTGALFIAATSGIAAGKLAHLSVRLTPGEVRLIGIGTTAGVVLQTLALWPSLRASGFRWRPRLDWRGPAGAPDQGLAAAIPLGGWVLVYVAVNQLGLVVITQLATAAGRAAQADHVGYGAGFSAYMNAYQLFQLPYAVVAVSVITALLPRMSSHAGDGRLADVRADLSTGLRTTGVAVVPATAALIVLAPQIATVVFRCLPHTHISDADARYIGWVIAAFGTGLVAFSMFQLLLRAFYALHDTRTPALINVSATAVNIAADVVLYAVLPPAWRVVGLALGFSLSYWVALALTARAVGRRLQGLDGHRVVRTYVRLTVASLLAGAVAFGLARLTVALLGHGLASSVIALLAGAGIGGGVLVTAAGRMHVDEASGILRLVRQRLGA